MNAYVILLSQFFFFRGVADRRMLAPGLLHFGGVEVQDSDKLLEQAVDLAKDTDGAIAIVGLNDEWETEGDDRTTLSLPGRTDELIARVAAVNSKTVVVTQAVCVVVLLLKRIYF
jgi:beta-glucosidase